MRSNLDIKVFQINCDHYELRILSIVDKVKFIIDSHKNNHKEGAKYSIDEFERDNTKYILYQYSELKEESNWKGFLTEMLSNEMDYQLKQFSFSLFAINNGNIFVIIGGNSLQVIKKFINEKFGIELYEYISKQNEDIVLSLTTRGITGNLSEQRELYRKNQTLFDSIELTNIPSKIVIEIRDELKNGYFEFINFRNEKSYLEIGSFFFIKVKLNFEQFHFLIETINLILTENISNPLTSFIRIKDVNFIEEKLENQLFINLKEEIFETFSPTRGADPYKMDIDFIHPTKILEFYECDEYELKSKLEQKPFYKTSDKSKLYNECLKFIYENVQDLNDLFELRKVISGLRIKGYRREKLKTQAMFLNHLNTEIKVDNSSYFKVDNYWYKIENNFLNKINDLCYETYINNKIQEPFLFNKWDSSIKDEDEYNKSYKSYVNYYVFDKVFSDNIELCDIMYENEKAIYLIHVKDKFDAKIRDLSNQVLVASNRLWHDLKNVKNSNFLETIVDSYNSKSENSNNQLIKKDFLSKFNSDKNIIFVMAFKTVRSRFDLKERFAKSESNIAKYTIVQSKKDITKFQLQYFDLTENIK